MSGQLIPEQLAALQEKLDTVALHVWVRVAFCDLLDAHAAMAQELEDERRERRRVEGLIVRWGASVYGDDFGILWVGEQYTQEIVNEANRITAAQEGTGE